jgi:hypothetical protein
MITSTFLLACFFSMLQANPTDRSTFEPPLEKWHWTQDKKNRENQITTRFSPGLMPRQFPLPTIYMLPII